ncbi:HAMP domain-containing sensor histidine kinase [Persicobacter diffluens]|uniref:histidine kinase n=1 Tax=Persicobacter diffluens TaxID=981 RepID=A0AAN4VWD3_9BACT|nr:hypothetical protein PEDI_00620 [Persicobacter diffluens]
MNKRNLNIVILIMCLSTLGLLAFQLYWVGNAMKVNEERFNQDVHLALNAVAANLEQQEVLHRVQKQQEVLVDTDFFYWVNQQSPGGRHAFQNGFFQNPLQARLNAMNSFEQQMAAVEQEMQQMMLDVNIDVGAFPKGAQQFDFSFSAESSNGPDGHFAFQVISGDSLLEFHEPAMKSGDQIVIQYPSPQLKKNGWKKTWPELKEKALEEQKKKMEERTKMVQRIVDQMFAAPRTVAQRLNKNMLDSLLSAELSRRGMNINFHYAVMQDDQFLMNNMEPGQLQNLKQTDFKTILYPNDFFSSNTKLLLDFPEKKRFLIGQVGVAMGSSLLLVLMMILCFAYAVHIILRQKKLSVMKNDFVNNMTHEFKTPIATVSLACEALADPDMRTSPTIVDRYLGIIRNENKRLGQQVEKVLQVARMDRERMKVKWETVDVAEILRQSAEHIALQVEKRGGKVICELKAERTVIRTDRVHLSNIVENLLDNANKYSPEAPWISLSLSQEENGLRITVQDHGCGMNKEHLSNIFDKFYRIPTGNVHNVKGFGLGLSYVKSAVDALGAQIEVNSQLGKGSTFSLFLPYGTER